MVELIRKKPDLFLKGVNRNRKSVAYLIDDLLRCVFIGPAATNVIVEVTTEGNFRVKRDGMTSFEHFADIVDGSMIEGMLQASLDPSRAVAKKLAPIVTAIALSSSASITWGNLKQSFYSGVPTQIENTGNNNFDLELTLSLDPSIFNASLDAFPFKSRVQELATLTGNSALKIDYRYMGFPPYVIEPKKGILDLLDFMAPETKNNPTFRLLTKDYDLDIALRVDRNSEMEKLKTFEDAKEVFNSPFEQVARESLVRYDFPTRRHSLNPLSTAKLSYFGTYTANSPFELTESGDHRIDTVPQLVGVISSKGNVDSYLQEFSTKFRRWICSTLL